MPGAVTAAGIAAVGEGRSARSRAGTHRHFFGGHGRTTGRPVAERFDVDTPHERPLNRRSVGLDPVGRQGRSQEWVWVASGASDSWSWRPSGLTGWPRGGTL